jgi:phage gp36-like protein
VAYVTVEQLRESLENAGGAGSRTAAVLPTHRLEANLEEAVGQVVGTLHAFTLPDPGEDPTTSPETVPALLRTIIIGIAGYLATLEHNGSQPLEDRDPMNLRYARAVALLAQITGGHLKVYGIDVESGETAATGDAAIYQPPGTGVGLADVFNPDSLPGRHNSPAYFGGVRWG